MTKSICQYGRLRKNNSDTEAKTYAMWVTSHRWENANQPSTDFENALW